jgi:hypothetical protein
MKKLIALGVGAISAASLVIGAAPAHAVEPVIATPQFCSDLSVTIATLNAQALAADGALSTANAAVTTTRGALDEALGSWVGAAVNLVKAVDLGQDTSVQQAAYNVATTALTTAGTAWSQAKLAAFNAQNNDDLAHMVAAIYQGAQSGLCALP